MRRLGFPSRLFRTRGLTLSVLAVGIVVLSAALVVMLLDWDLPADKARPSAAAQASTGEGPPAAPVKLDARMEAAAIDVQAGRNTGDLSSLSAVEVPPPLRSVDAANFRDGERIIRLAGIVAPRANDVCFDGEARWSCGLQARAALHNTIAGRSLFCQPRGVVPEIGITADCRLDARDSLPSGDVARLLVRQGWARPMPANEADFADDIEAARAASAGLWRGGWRIATP